MVFIKGNDVRVYLHIEQRNESRSQVVHWKPMRILILIQGVNQHTWSFPLVIGSPKSHDYIRHERNTEGEVVLA